MPRRSRRGYGSCLDPGPGVAPSPKGGKASKGDRGEASWPATREATTGLPGTQIDRLKAETGRPAQPLQKPLRRGDRSSKPAARARSSGAAVSLPSRSNGADPDDEGRALAGGRCAGAGHWTPTTTDAIIYPVGIQPARQSGSQPAPFIDPGTPPAEDPERAITLIGTGWAPRRDQRGSPDRGSPGPARPAGFLCRANPDINFD